MKIVVQRYQGGFSFGEDDEKCIRTALAHITHKIWIKSVSSEGNGRIVVDYEPQSLTRKEGDDFASLISEAISLRGYLTLVSVEAPQEMVEIKGLSLIEQDEASATYRAFPIFLIKMAENEPYHRNVAHKKVVNVSFEMVEGRTPGTLAWTGTSSFTTAPGPLTMPNAYNKLGAVLCNDEHMRESILSGRMNALLLTVKNDGSFTIQTNEKIQESQNEAGATIH